MINATRATLGAKYRDTITGFEGIAVSRTEFLYGCVRVALESGDKDNKSVTEYVDEQRLIATNEHVRMVSGAVSGGPGDVPTQWSGE